MDATFRLSTSIELFDPDVFRAALMIQFSGAKRVSIDVAAASINVQARLFFQRTADAVAAASMINKSTKGTINDEWRLGANVTAHPTAIVILVPIIEPAPPSSPRPSPPLFETSQKSAAGRQDTTMLIAVIAAVAIASVSLMLLCLLFWGRRWLLGAKRDLLPGHKEIDAQPVDAIVADGRGLDGRGFAMQTPKHSVPSSLSATPALVTASFSTPIRDERQRSRHAGLQDSASGSTHHLPSSPPSSRSMEMTPFEVQLLSMLRRMREEEREDGSVSSGDENEVTILARTTEIAAGTVPHTARAHQPRAHQPSCQLPTREVEVVITAEDLAQRSCVPPSVLSTPATLARVRDADEQMRI